VIGFGGPVVMAAGKITVGDHAVTTKLFGLTIDVDIVYSTLAAGAIVLALGFLLRAKATSGVPGKLQVFWEFLVEQVQDLTDSVIGPQGREIVPLAITLFLLILTCNWLGFIPAAPNLSTDWLPPATADVNLPLAMALVVWIWSNAKAIRNRGLRGYGRHYLQPYAVMAPINVIEELTKPITLTFRLFGNVFSGALMIVVIASLLPAYVSWVGFLLWKPFELFIGLIQAFIFALLTVMYFGMAMSTESH
jgi:F-type H+-transporting ATPase subunit a